MQPFLNRRMKAAGSANDLEVDEADDLLAPEVPTTTHGFVVGNVLRRATATTNVKAQGDSDANTGVGLSVVVHVEDVDNYSILRRSNSHDVTVSAHGFGAFGVKLYLSTTVAGEMTPTEIVGSRLYLGYVVDADTIHWEPDWVRF